MVVHSIKRRFLTSFVANVVRAGFLFIAGLLVARGLGPHDYGVFMFLSGSFMALIQFLDMGSTVAFYTFLSQKNRGRRFVVAYLFWQALQFILPVFLIVFLLPAKWIDSIWLGHSKALIILAFVAIFLKQQLWQTVTQIGESQRLTYRVQVLSVGVAITYLLLVGFFWFFGKVTISTMFQIMAFQYFVVFILAWVWFMPPRSDIDRKFSIKEVFREYRVYCTPLILSSWVGFAYTFADNWLLQSYGGAKQQGFYSIGYQFAMIGQVMTLAMFQIVWKEIAEAYNNGHAERAKQLYQKSSRILYTLVGMVCIFFVPWSKDIIYLTTGSAYIDGWPILTLMFFYPLHQSLCCIADAWLLSTMQVRAQVIMGIIFMVVSVGVSYFIQSSRDAVIPGLALGGLGMALKIVILNAMYVVAKLYWISRKQKWCLDWFYQVVIAAGFLFCTMLAYKSVEFINHLISFHFIFRIGLAVVLYITIIVFWIIKFPGTFGLTKGELEQYLGKLKTIPDLKRFIPL